MPSRPTLGQSCPLPGSPSCAVPLNCQGTLANSQSLGQSAGVEGDAAIPGRIKGQTGAPISLVEPEPCDSGWRGHSGAGVEQPEWPRPFVWTHRAAWPIVLISVRTLGSLSHKDPLESVGLLQGALLDYPSPAPG